MTTDDLSSATQSGGDPDGWPEDVWSLIVWAAIGSGSWPDTTPHLDIEAERGRGGDPRIVLEGLAGPIAQQPAHVVLAAAWAGLAGYATDRRDDAICAATGKGATNRQVAQYVGLSHPAIAAIRARGVSGRES